MFVQKLEVLQFKISLQRRIWNLPSNLVGLQLITKLWLWSYPTFMTPLLACHSFNQCGGCGWLKIASDHNKFTTAHVDHKSIRKMLLHKNPHCLCECNSNSRLLGYRFTRPPAHYNPDNEIQDNRTDLPENVYSPAVAATNDYGSWCPPGSEPWKQGRKVFASEFTLKVLLVLGVRTLLGRRITVYVIWFQLNFGFKFPQFRWIYFNGTSRTFDLPQCYGHEIFPTANLA